MLAPLTSRSRRILTCLLVFTASFLFLFLGMDRSFDFYDEGINLLDAMRVGAGQVPHRDFYVNYGPAQFYTLAALFRLFGPSVFVERIYDLVVRSAIVTVTWDISAAYGKRWVAVCTATACVFWMFSAGLPTIAYPIIPVLLLTIVGSQLLLRIFREDAGKWRWMVSGFTAGLVTLFRYDIGVALVLVHLASICIAVSLRKGTRAGLRTTLHAMSFYLLGVAIIFLPPALLYLSVAPISAFLHDVIIYPGKYYARARRLPFPVPHWRSLETLAVYLPLFVAVLCFYVAITRRRHARRTAPVDEQERMGLLILFGLMSATFYLKGIVRVSVVHMLLSLILTTIALAVLYDWTGSNRPRLHRVVQGALWLSFFTATWSALKEVRVLRMTHDSVLQEVLSPPGPAVLASETAWCRVPNRLHTGLCFLVDPSYIETLSYLAAHTRPDERIFIGLNRHDRVRMNDMVSYFAIARLPATHWAQYDPDLQMRADIQRAMIGELEDQKVRYVVLESQFDATVEPYNDSSRSTGITLLDDYIRASYRVVDRSGALSVWLRRGDAP